MPRNLRSSIIFSLLFCFVFPWSLAAETRQAPQNSLTYFLESDQAGPSQTPTVVPPPERPEPSQAANMEPEKAPVNETAANTPPFDRNAAIEAMRARIADNAVSSATSNETPGETVKEASIPVIAPEPVIPAVKETVLAQKPVEPTVKETKISQPVQAKSESDQITPAPVAQPEQIQTATDDSVPFSAALAKMQQNRDKRAAEAAKLGVVLPSQGGDIATVSPSLSKMQQAIRAIMTR